MYSNLNIHFFLYQKQDLFCEKQTFKKVLFYHKRLITNFLTITFTYFSDKYINLCSMLH